MMVFNPFDISYLHENSFHYFKDYLMAKLRPYIKVLVYPQLLESFFFWWRTDCNLGCKLKSQHSKHYKI